MHKYLIISPSWLGDIIMSQSLMIALKKLTPECHIDVYAPAYAHPILDRMPEVDGKIVNPFAHGSFALQKRFSEGRKLAKNHYDSVFVLPNSLKSALIAMFAGIRDRRGFKGESRYFILNNMRTNKNDFPRMVERYVALAFDKNEVKTRKDLPDFSYPKLNLMTPSSQLMTRLGIKPTGRPFLALGCGANYGPAKLWPVEYFAKVCNYWISSGGSVLGLGTAKDLVTVMAIQKEIADENLPFFHAIAGNTSLTEALDLVGICKAAVCNDSGMMHTVAAAGIPQICIFGSTSTGYTPPLSHKAVCLESDEPCHPCFRRTCQYGTYMCLKKISADLVIQNLKQLLDK